MIPRRIHGFNRMLGAPLGWDKERDGSCSGLAVRVVGDPRDGLNHVQCKSAWEPTPEELALLNAGGSVILTIVGGQPAVMITVEPSVQE